MSTGDAAGPSLGPGVHHLDAAAAQDRAGDAEAVGSAAEVDALLERRNLPRPVDAEALDELRAAARRVGVAERVVRRTRDRTAQSVVERGLVPAGGSTGTAVSVHPETIRDAAAALLDARAALARLGPAPPEQRAAAPEPASPTEAGSEAEAASRTEAGSPGRPLEEPWSPGPGRRRAAAGALVGAGGALVALSFGPPLWVSLIPLVLGLVLASFALRVPDDVLEAVEGADETDDAVGRDAGGVEQREAARFDRSGSSPSHGDAEGTARLAEISALSDRAFGGRTHSLSVPSGGGAEPRGEVVRPGAVDSGAVEPGALEQGAGPQADGTVQTPGERRAERILAEEQVRVAERAWRELAGETDPAEVDEVVRRYDPQHRDALVLAAEAVAVRGARRLLERALTGWEGAWSDLGLDPPPDDLDVGHALEDLVARATTPVRVEAGAHDDVDRLHAALPAAPIVVISGS